MRGVFKPIRSKKTPERSVHMAALAFPAKRTIQRAVNAAPRWPLYLLGAVPGVWVFWLALNDQLGPIR